MVRYAGGVILVAVFLIFPTGALYIIKFHFVLFCPHLILITTPTSQLKKIHVIVPGTNVVSALTEKRRHRVKILHFSAVQFSPSLPPPPPKKKKIHYVITLRAIYGGDSFTGFALIAVIWEKHLIWSFEIYSTNKIW